MQRAAAVHLHVAIVVTSNNDSLLIIVRIAERYAPAISGSSFISGFKASNGYIPLPRVPCAKKINKIKNVTKHQSITKGGCIHILTAPSRPAVAISGAPYPMLAPPQPSMAFIMVLCALTEYLFKLRGNYHMRDGKTSGGWAQGGGGPF
jgi:hypothetical protein